MAETVASQPAAHCNIHPSVQRLNDDAAAAVNDRLRFDFPITIVRPISLLVGSGWPCRRMVTISRLSQKNGRYQVRGGGRPRRLSSLWSRAWWFVIWSWRGRRSWLQNAPIHATMKISHTVQSREGRSGGWYHIQSSRTSSSSSFVKQIPGKVFSFAPLPASRHIILDMTRVKNAIFVVDNLLWPVDEIWCYTRPTDSSPISLGRVSCDSLEKKEQSLMLLQASKESASHHQSKGG